MTFPGKRLAEQKTMIEEEENGEVGKRKRERGERKGSERVLYPL